MDSRIHLGNLLGVTVEHQRRPNSLTEKRIPRFADALLAGLAPSRMLDRRIDVRVEAVRLGPRLHPRAHGLFFDESDRDDGFDALEAVLPRSDQSQRRSIRIGQWLSIYAECDQRQRIHRFVESETFHIRPIQTAAKQS